MRNQIPTHRRTITKRTSILSQYDTNGLLSLRAVLTADINGKIMSNHHRHLCDKRPLEHHRAIDRWMLTNLSFHEPVNHSHPIGGCVRFCYRFSFRPLFAQFDFLILSPKHSTIWLLFCGFEGFLIEASCILWHMSKYFSNGDRRPSTKRAICNIFAWVVGI